MSLSTLQISQRSTRTPNHPDMIVVVCGVHFLVHVVLYLTVNLLFILCNVDQNDKMFLRLILRIAFRFELMTAINPNSAT